MSARRLGSFSLLNHILPGVGLLALFSAPSLMADPPKEPARPAVKSANSATDLLRQSLEKLRTDLGPDDPAVKQLEQALKAVTEPKPEPIPAPLFAPPPQAVRGDGDDFFEMAEELQQQMEMLKNAIQGGGLQLRGGGLGGLQGNGGFGGPFLINPNVMPGLGVNLGKGRFGIRIEAPSDVLAAQLDLPPGQGIVCADVPADSVAGKAGIKSHDVLLEVAGKPVSSNPAEFINQIKGVKADQAIDVVVLRKGRKETIKGIKLPEAAELQPFQQMQMPLPQMRVPQIQLLPLQQPFPAFQQPFAGGPGEQIQVQQQDSAFTVQMSKDGAKMTMTGNKEDGKPVIGSIEVDAGGKITRAERIDKLPKEYQGMAEKALKSVR